jgi:hypothetical protein
MIAYLTWMFKDFSKHLLTEVVLVANWLKLCAVVAFEWLKLYALKSDSKAAF